MQPGIVGQEFCACAEVQPAPPARVEHDVPKACARHSTQDAAGVRGAGDGVRRRAAHGEVREVRDEHGRSARGADGARAQEADDISRHAPALRGLHRRSRAAGRLRRLHEELLPEAFRDTAQHGAVNPSHPSQTVIVSTRSSNIDAHLLQVM